MSQKTTIIELILLKLTEQYKSAIAATQQAHATATHKENIAENKYDTLGLEAGYLAFGQSQRVAESAADLEAWKAMKIIPLSSRDAIKIGALITLLDEDENELVLFLGPANGGIKIQDSGTEITVVTVGAPLGKALLGQYQDDEFELQLGNKTKKLLVESVT